MEQPEAPGSFDFGTIPSSSRGSNGTRPTRPPLFGASRPAGTWNEKTADSKGLVSMPSTASLRDLTVEWCAREYTRLFRQLFVSPGAIKGHRVHHKPQASMGSRGALAVRRRHRRRAFPVAIVLLGIVTGVIAVLIASWLGGMEFAR